MLQQYARHYERLWQNHWWWQARKQYVLGHIRRLAADRPLKQILDIGCGNGLFFEALESFGQVQGLEADPELVPPESPWRGAIQIRPLDETTRFDHPMDLVLMLDVLEHIADDRAALAQVFGLLSPGGTLVLTVPALMSLWSRHDVANQHFRRYRRGGLGELLEASGFDISHLGYFYLWSMPLLYARRLTQGVGESAGDYQVQVPPRGINALMYGLSRLEQVIEPSGGWPVGSSLLAVARRR